jgi:NAD(P)H-flavin reductase
MATKKATKTNQILEKRILAPSITMYKLYVPDIARKVKAGQFVVVRGDDMGERIPLTVADYDSKKGTITIIFQEVGTSTQKLAKFEAGMALLDVVGPLGKPSHIEKFGTVVCVGGGVGVAPACPSQRPQGGATRSSPFIGARTQSMLILEEEMKKASTTVHVTTDDGTYGHHGFVTDV